MNTLKTLLSAAAVIAASFTVTAPVHADGAVNSTCGAWRCGFNGTELNSLRVNGVRFNGVQFNGAILQGVTLQGVTLQGITLQGVRLNGPGLMLQGPAANGIHDEGKMVPVAVRLANGKLVTLR